MKILGIFLILGGLGGILEGNFLSGLLIMGLGVFFFKKKKQIKTKHNSFETQSKKITKTEPMKSDSKELIFRVAGVTYEGRQGTIKEIVKDWKECNPEDLYEGLKNKDIEIEDEPIYEVDIYDWIDLELIPEPTNDFDKNAIRVDSDFGVLGYVPADTTSRVKKILEQDHSISWKVIGGKYKYYDDAEDKVRTKTLTYGIEITLNY